MAPIALSVTTHLPVRSRSALLASADAAVRASLRSALKGMRWSLREVSGAAETLNALDGEIPEVLLLDHWLPDIEVNELAALVRLSYPALEILRVDGHSLTPESRSTHRAELLSAIRIAGEQGATERSKSAEPAVRPGQPWKQEQAGFSQPSRVPARPRLDLASTIPSLIGQSAAMRELSRLIRLVAPRNTTVLIEGPTGSGKELVAGALHALSHRSSEAMVVLNCAAIPESLLEAELFGHTRGAFTGATQSRTGRIEAADGGTLFLDEIGEMPLALQAKMLRFLECGEIQRVGDNTVGHVDVRVVAATHQPLEQRAEEGSFRLDLYHRLAVFPIEVPALSHRMDDLPALAEHFLDRLGHNSGRQQLSPGALEELLSHRWPGNVRELMHVLERAVILAGDVPTLERAHIRIRRRPRA